MRTHTHTHTDSHSYTHTHTYIERHTCNYISIAKFLWENAATSDKDGESDEMNLNVRNVREIIENKLSILIR